MPWMARAPLSSWGNPWLDSWVYLHYRNSHAALVGELSSCRSVEEKRFQSGLGGLFNFIEQARILTFTRKGRHGCEAVNRRICERLIGRWDPAVPAQGIGGFNGSLILILENDYSKGLFNGDVGVFLRLQGRSLGCFRRGDAFLFFPAAFLPCHETAFAMTVHKSQGSEYDQILLVLPEAGNRFLLKKNSMFDFNIVQEKKIGGESTGSSEAAAPGMENFAKRMQVINRMIKSMTATLSIPELLDRTMTLVFAAIDCNTC